MVQQLQARTSPRTRCAGARCQSSPPVAVLRPWGAPSSRLERTGTRPLTSQRFRGAGRRTCSWSADAARCRRRSASCSRYVSARAPPRLVNSPRGQRGRVVGRQRPGVLVCPLPRHTAHGSRPRVQAELRGTEARRSLQRQDAEQDRAQARAHALLSPCAAPRRPAARDARRCCAHAAPRAGKGDPGPPAAGPCPTLCNLAHPCFRSC
jgi:hypothetical protein